MKFSNKSYLALENLLCTPENLRKDRLPSISQNSQSLTAVDLFCGCGGLSFGALQAGLSAKRNFRIELAIDNNASALTVYKQNFSKSANFIEMRDVEELVDVQDLSTSPAAKEAIAWKNFAAVDLILAGPPCQGHSDLNNSSRRSDPRNSLYLAPARAAVSLRPKVLLIENVPTVVKSKEDVVGKSHVLLSRLGYHVVELTLDLTRLGVPQTRTRHVQLASLKPLDNLVREVSKLPKRTVACWEYIIDLVDQANHTGHPFARTTKLSAANITRINYLFDNSIYDLPNELRPKCHRDREHSYVSMYGRIDPKKPSQTITSGFGSMGQGRFVHPTRPRMITPHEAARLQGFPDSFSFENCAYVTALREMIGNAVPPTMSSALISLLISHGHLG